MKKRTINKKKISKECWNLDLNFYRWLYDRLPIYLKEASKIVDLEYYKFNFDREELTQRECIELMINDLAYLINTVGPDSWCEEYEITRDRLLNTWAKVCPSMWW